MSDNTHIHSSHECVSSHFTLPWCEPHRKQIVQSQDLTALVPFEFPFYPDPGWTEHNFWLCARGYAKSWALWLHMGLTTTLRNWNCYYPLLQTRRLKVGEVMWRILPSAIQPKSGSAGAWNQLSLQEWNHWILLLPEWESKAPRDKELTPSDASNRKLPASRQSCQEVFKNFNRHCAALSIQHIWISSCLIV